MGIRAYQGLLQPTSGQEQRLGALLEAQRRLYNAALEERRGAWAWEHRSVSRFDQFRCTDCGHETHADVNAARNILRAGLARRPAREAA